MESKEQISYRMRKVKSKNSKIELILRSVLWKKGLRYRKHYGKVMGCPDIAFPGKKVVVFCDSEFWHGYDWVNYKKHAFKSNKNFWVNKIEHNIARDKQVNKFLTDDGWEVLRFWGKDIQKNTQRCVNKIEKTLGEDAYRKEPLLKIFDQLTPEAKLKIKLTKDKYFELYRFNN